MQRTLINFNTYRIIPASCFQTLIHLNHLAFNLKHENYVTLDNGHSIPSHPVQIIHLLRENKSEVKAVRERQIKEILQIIYRISNTLIINKTPDMFNV